MSVEASLSESREAAARIPADVARRVHSRHALAVESEHGLFATTPDRMLAPPVDVQGYQWDRAKTHLLLLELSSNDGLGHHLGEGVYQFCITPARFAGAAFRQGGAHSRRVLTVVPRNAEHYRRVNRSHQIRERSHSI